MKMCLRCMEQYPDNKDACPYCGFQSGTAQAGSGLPLECILEKRYLVGSVLHSGTEMISYIGWDEYLQCKVEIQEYYPLTMVCRDADGIDVQLQSGSMKEDFRVGCRRFLYEARRLVPYMHYSCMLKIIDTFQANHTIYIVRKYEKGRPLNEYLEKHPLPEQAALSEINSILDFLSSFHAGGMLIGDLSPDRLLLTDSGSVCISDYSQVIDVGSMSKQQDKAVYNGYLPMEAASSAMKPVSDVYTAGALLYNMLTGKDPLPPSARLSHNQELEFPPEAHISEMTQTALHNAMLPRSADRTQTTEEFRKELNGQGATRLVGGEVQEHTDTGAFKNWHKLALIAIACVLVAVIGLAVATAVRKSSMGDITTTADGEIKVPDVVGMTVDEAVEEMKKAGLSAQVTGRVYNDTVEAGKIFSQSVEAGKTASAGSVIALTVCMGKEVQYVLPNLVGEELSKWETELREHFELNVVEKESNYPAGVISYQSQMPGVYDKYISMTVYVSTGMDYREGVTVPITDYVGRTYSESFKLELADLKVLLSVKEERSSEDQKGKVIRQSLAPGEYPEGTALEIVVGRGPGSVEVKDYTAQRFADVKAMLEQEGIIVNPIEEPNDQYAAGLIFNQDVKSGTLNEGDTITLYVAKAVEKIIEPKPITLGNYFGRNIDEVSNEILAQGTASNINITVNTRWQEDDSHPVNTIIEQSKPAGSLLNDGETLVLTYAVPQKQDEPEATTPPEEPAPDVPAATDAPATDPLPTTPPEVEDGPGAPAGPVEPEGPGDPAAQL